MVVCDILYYNESVIMSPQTGKDFPVVASTESQCLEYEHSENVWRGDSGCLPLELNYWGQYARHTKF